MKIALAPLQAFLSAIFIYAAAAVLLYPLIAGIFAVRRAIESMAAGAADPEIKSANPSVRDLWLTLGRWTRSIRAEARARQAELESARAVFAALPEPLLLLDQNRRVVGSNAAAHALLGTRLEGRDLAGALRHPLVLAATDQVLRADFVANASHELRTPLATL